MTGALDLPAPEPHQPVKRQPLVVRMTNPAAYQLPEIRRLFLAANARTQDPEFRSAQLAASCRDPRVGIFIGIEDGLPKAVVGIELSFGDVRLCWPTDHVEARSDGCSD